MSSSACCSRRCRGLTGHPSCRPCPNCRARTSAADCQGLWGVLPSRAAECGRPSTPRWGTHSCSPGRSGRTSVRAYACSSLFPSSPSPILVVAEDDVVPDLQLMLSGDLDHVADRGVPDGACAATQRAAVPLDDTLDLCSPLTASVAALTRHVRPRSLCAQRTPSRPLRLHGSGRPPRTSPRCTRSASKHRRGSRGIDRKSTRLNSSHVEISYAVFCLKKKTKLNTA